jgi:hypothetical protein
MAVVREVTALQHSNTATMALYQESYLHCYL